MSNPAETYESYMVPALFAPWAVRLVETANPQPGERVLDVGCGTGIAARRIATVSGTDVKVSGIDASPNMLAVARAAAEREGLNISWHEGRAEELLFPDGSFDLVLSQFALMFFGNRYAALSEMRRVLTEDGRVAISVWQSIGRHPFYQKLHEVISERLGMSGVQDIFALGDEDELGALLTDAGFEQVQISQVSMTARFPDPEGFLAGEIDVDTASVPSMQHLDDQERQGVIRAITEDMKAPLREVTQEGHVVLPFHAHIAIARR